MDAGCGGTMDLLLENIRACGVDPESIRYLLITHCHFDHTGGARRLRDELGCEVVMHELDAPFLIRGDAEVTAASWYGADIEPCPVDRLIVGDEGAVMLGERTIRAMHMPGHSPGSMVYLMESGGEQVLFGQDVHGPLHPSLLSDRGDYNASLHHMIDLNADILCEGHYGIYRGRDEVRRFIESFLR